jgi:hypothetical protein
MLGRRVMRMKKIHYVSFYLNQDEVHDRALVVAAQSKISYIADSIKRAGFNLEIVSTTFTQPMARFSRKKIINVDSRENHVYLPAMGSVNGIQRKIRLPFMQISLFLHLFFHVGKEDVILAYHSLAYIKVIRLLAKLRKIKFVLELNDLYALHFTDKEKTEKIKRMECKYFKLPDAFLLASPYMVEIIPPNRPTVISYGSYKAPSTDQRVNDGKIHVIYTGVIENLRGAGKLVANTARYLTRDYVIHIAGYGTDECINEIDKLCSEINVALGYEAIIFHGLLIGKAFDDLLDRCHIAINGHTYSNEDLWKSKFSFPSKIPLNMCHGLCLVSHDMPLISKSEFARFTAFFSEFSPDHVAKAIQECAVAIKGNSSNQTPKDLLREMDGAFVENVKVIFDAL